MDLLPAFLLILLAGVVIYACIHYWRQPKAERRRQDNDLLDW